MQFKSMDAMDSKCLLHIVSSDDNKRVSLLGSV